MVSKLPKFHTKRRGIGLFGLVTGRVLQIAGEKSNGSYHALSLYLQLSKDLMGENIISTLRIFRVGAYYT
jgi:hypothetical protein